MCETLATKHIRTVSSAISSRSKMAPSAAPKLKASKIYPQSSFKKLLRARAGLALANDNTDMLVYLIYMDYLAKLLRSNGKGELSEATIQNRHNQLMKRYRG